MAQKILIIQTAFIGDVVLATAMLESIHQQNPATSISILVRKGNEALFNLHPFIDQVFVWVNKNANGFLSKPIFILAPDKAVHKPVAA